MIYPIVAYGDPVLKKRGEEVTVGYPKLDVLVKDMFETMYNAKGVGLAAPQIGKSIRLFVVDASPFAEDEPELKTFVKVFINPVIVEEEGEEWYFNEGCLSIPQIREDVLRNPSVLLRYQDENFNFHEEKFHGIAARIIQHEHDHIEGKLFIDRLSVFKRRLLQGKLTDISKGKVETTYKMRFYNKK